jgi:hydrogenase maturation protease
MIDASCHSYGVGKLEHRQTIAVIGIGNLLLSDDGIGIHAVRSLRSNPRTCLLSRIIDGGTVGTDLLGEICGCEQALIVDAVDAGQRPGTIVWMDLNSSDLPRIQTRNAHQSGIYGLLDDLRLLGCAPQQIVLVGVQPASLSIGTQLSPEVASAIPALEKEIVWQLEQWISGKEFSDMERYGRTSLGQE